MSVVTQPDCSIDLEDLRIDPHDRTSISGEGIKPGVRMKVNEGDMLILGKSGRFYRLNWIPLSCSYDTINKETEEAMDQEENSYFCSNDQMNTLSLSMQKVSSTVPLKPEENQFPQTCGGSLKKQLPVLNATAFCPLPVNFISYHRAERKPESELDEMEMEMTFDELSVDGRLQKISRCGPVSMFQEKFWIIVVDTQCLLNKMSMRELKLMRGLRRTRLLIPQIVVRELDCMLKRGSFFRRTAEVSAALKWIEESMSVSNWWINVETSSEESNNRLFARSTSTTLQDIVTPTAADLILGYALFYRSTQNKDGQLVILSDDVTLKIKAMAEGAICEAAQYFRESLVNPFSDRFLYSESSPVGPHPFHIDAAVHLHGYYPKPSKRLSESFQIAAGLEHI